MDHVEFIQKTLDYIDRHITEKLSATELASQSGFSVFHFYRLFQKYVGMSVMEYVTVRKLTYSFEQLRNQEKVIDIAMRYQFETHAGYTKAFKKHFGYSPHYYRSHVPYGLPLKVDLSQIKEMSLGGVLLEPELVEQSKILIAGYRIQIPDQEFMHPKERKAFWDSCDMSGKEERLYETQMPKRHGEYGICINNFQESMDYFLGVEVDNHNLLEEGMQSLYLPAGKYAVFTTPAVPEKEFVASIRGTWNYVLEEWIPNSCYEIVDEAPDYEFYDERCHAWEQEKLQMQIWIPIRRRNHKLL